MSAVMALLAAWFLFNIAVVAILMIRTMPPRSLRWSFPVHRMQYARIHPTRRM